MVCVFFFYLYDFVEVVFVYYFEEFKVFNFEFFSFVFYVFDVNFDFVGVILYVYLFYISLFECFFLVGVFGCGFFLVFFIGFGIFNVWLFFFEFGVNMGYIEENILVVVGFWWCIGIVDIKMNY